MAEGEGISPRGRGKLRGAQRGDPRRDYELFRYGLFDASPGIAGSLPRIIKDHISAVEQGAHVAVAQAFDQRAQVRHCDSLGAADVDAAKQGDVAAIHPGGDSRSRRCSQATSCQAPNFRPTPLKTPTGSNPTLRWNATLASLGSAIPASALQKPFRASSSKSAR